MSGIYPVDYETTLFLYARDNHIYMRYKTGAYFGKPTLLASDYASGLIEISTTQTIYFAYLSNTQQIMVKDLRGNLLCQVPCQALKGANFAFVFTKIGDTPILIFPTNNTASETSRYPLSYMFPLSFAQNHANFTIETEPISTPTNHPTTYPLQIEIQKPQFLYPIATRDALFLLLSSTERTALYRMPSAPGGPCICLVGPEKEIEDSIQMELLEQALSTKEQLTQKLKEKFAQEKEALQQEFLTQKNLQTTALQQELLKNTDLETELHRTKEMLQSAISQYNELMDVATKYKAEAEKWRSKYWR